MENKITISPKAKTYDIKMQYHSDLMCENYDAEIHASHISDGRITILPREHLGAGFVFESSDPDRVITIAKMILAFAEMAKEENKKPIDISNKV